MKNNQELKKTLIIIPDGYKYVIVKHVGKILVETIKDIPNGSHFKTIYIDELVTNPIPTEKL